MYCHGEIYQVCENWFNFRCPIDPDYKKNKLRIAVLGGDWNGKSTLVHRFRTGAFPSKHIDRSIEDTYRGNIMVNTFNAKTQEIKQRKLMLEILDTARNYSYGYAPNTWYKQNDIMILTFAINQHTYGTNKILDGVMKY